MIWTIKDIISVITLLGMSIGGFMTLKYYHKSQKDAIRNQEKDIKKQKEETDLLKCVIFKPTGGLNLVDNATCNQHRVGIQERITAESATVKKLFTKLDTLDENIITIMGHLNITEKRQRG
jgi:hypothetical protein